MMAQADSRSGPVRGQTGGANMTQRSGPGNPKVAPAENEDGLPGPSPMRGGA